MGTAKSIAGNIRFPEITCDNRIVHLYGGEVGQPDETLFSEATNISSFTGMDNSVKTSNTSLPTRPVHPTIANFIL